MKPLTDRLVRIREGPKGTATNDPSRRRSTAPATPGPNHDGGRPPTSKRGRALGGLAPIAPANDARLTIRAIVP